MFALVILAMAGITYTLSYIKNIFIQKITTYNRLLASSNQNQLPELNKYFSYEVKHYSINENDLIDYNITNAEYIQLVDTYISLKNKYKRILVIISFLFVLLYLLTPKRFFDT